MSEAPAPKTLTYATPDGKPLAGDLYLPAGTVPFPVLITAHGGGWVQGVRGAFRHWGPYLAARGIATFAISYRLASAQQPTFPHAVKDVLAAVRFIRGNASEHGLDPQRIGLFGHSAGGNLCGLAALGADFPAFAPDPGEAHTDISADVKVLAGLYGVYDLAAMWQTYTVQSPRQNNLEWFTGASLLDDRRRYFEASPISHVTRAKNKLGVFLCTGTEDDLVDRHAHTGAFMLALKQASFYVRTCIVPGAGHYWGNDPIDELGSYGSVMGPRLVRFLEEKL